MYNKLPELTIFDEVEYSRYRIRWRHPETRKQQGLQVSYGKLTTKEDALEKIKEKREKLIEQLTPVLNKIKESKKKS